MQLYWNYNINLLSFFIEIVLSSCFLPNNFSEEYLWKAACEHLHYNKKRIYINHIILSI